MKGFLGEEIINIQKTQYASYSPAEWALFWIERYGGIDGGQHKNWVIDQVARILKGTQVIIKVAKWDNGYTEYRFSLGEPSVEYNNWVKNICDNDEGELDFDYDVGVAP